MHTLITNDWLGPWIKITSIDHFTALQIMSLDDPRQQGVQLERILFDELDVTRTSKFNDSTHHDPSHRAPFDVTASSYQHDNLLERNIFVTNEAFADFKAITNKNRGYKKVVKSYNAQLQNDHSPCVIEFKVTNEQFRSCPEFWLIALVEHCNSFHIIIRKHRHFCALSRFSHNANVTNMGRLQLDNNGLFADEQPIYT